MNILLDIAFGYKHTDDDDSFVLSLAQSISQKLTSYITQWKEKQTVSRISSIQLKRRSDSLHPFALTLLELNNYACLFDTRPSAGSK